LNRHDYYAFAADIRRLRPVVALVLSLIVLLPSIYEMASQALPPTVVLVRFAEALALIGTLCWLVSAVVLHYMRIQVQSEINGDREGEIHI